MIIRFFKFTKLPQLVTAMIISFLIMLAFKNLNDLISELYSLCVLILIFFLSLFIISKNSILKSNQYISLGLIIFCGVYFKMPAELNITLSYLFLLLAIRKVYSLNSKKNQNKKLFDIGFWFLISIILCPFNFIFILTILFGVFMFHKISVGAILKILTGVLTSAITTLFFLDLIGHVSFNTDSLIYFFDQIWMIYLSNEIITSNNYNHWLFASVSFVIFLYYSFNFFGNNLYERIKNLFLLMFFINSILLVFIINEYSIFLFFPFLVTLIKIISEYRNNLFFEIAVLIAIIINSYPYNI